MTMPVPHVSRKFHARKMNPTNMVDFQASAYLLKGSLCIVIMLVELRTMVKLHFLAKIYSIHPWFLLRHFDRNGLSWSFLRQCRPETSRVCVARDIWTPFTDVCCILKRGCFSKYSQSWTLFISALNFFAKHLRFTAVISHNFIIHFLR